MILNTPFRKAIFISCLSHLAVFGIFTLSFGRRIPPAAYPAVSCWGAVFNHLDFTAVKPSQRYNLDRFFIKRFNLPLLGGQPLRSYYLKPSAAAVFTNHKITFREPLSLAFPKKKESVIMFYPQLPEHFLLYFKDRQTVHIEVMFKITPKDGVESFEIKRRISSGNLEVDLLSMRYISNYLIRRKESFPRDAWQTVKIDLEPRR